MLALLYTTPSSISPAEFNVALGSSSPGKSAIRSALDSLSKENLVARIGKNRFSLHKAAPIYQGVLSQHPKGFGFIDISGSQRQNARHLAKDPFVPPHRMAGAHHGDTVLIRIADSSRATRPEASVIKILSQGANTIGGTYMEDGRNQFVYPDDRRFPFTIKIDKQSDQHPTHGDAVIVEYRRTEKPGRFLQGRIVEILGPAGKVDAQMRLVVQKFDLPCQFSSKAVEEAEHLATSFTLAPNRVDLRETIHVTIDGESAQDFDDAVSVAKTRRGYRLHVSIADVDHFVKRGSAIDQEAYARGTSVYFPGRAVPMLPERLSNDLCSLVPDKDRYTVSAILDFDRSGGLIKKSFCRSLIRSRKRFTYTMVKRILIDRDAESRRENKMFLTQLKWAGELAALLQHRRKLRGSIDFTIPEAEFIFSPSGDLETIRQAERTFAHQIIEEFMLAANEAVALLFTELSLPSLYRIHESPDQIKIEEFIQFARTLEPELPPFDNHPSWFAKIVNHFAGSQSAYIVNTLLLRSMKQAHYSDDNLGHFGLGSKNYTHFTSPIRRYPDLIVHRTLLEHLDNTSQPMTSRSRRVLLKEAGEFLSKRERNAMAAERDMHDRLKVSFMKNHIGETFDAIIAGVTESNLYVEIQEFCVSGSIAVELLDDDYYIFDAANHRLFGEITAKTFQLGDSLSVKLIAADIITRRISFKPATRSH
ncbi:MAG: ribonuclease R [Desulforhopalus sp.]